MIAKSTIGVAYKESTKKFIVRCRPLRIRSVQVIRKVLLQNSHKRN